MTTATIVLSATVSGLDHLPAWLATRHADALGSLAVADGCLVGPVAPEHVVGLVLDLLRIDTPAVGLGVARTEPSATRRAERARETAARPRRPVPIAVRGPGRARDGEAVLILLGAIRRKRSTTGWAAVDAMVRAGGQSAAARVLGISQQAVSQRLAAAGWHEEAIGRLAAERLLAGRDR